MDEKYTLSATPVPTIEQQNRAWRDFHSDTDDLIKRLLMPTGRNAFTQEPVRDKVREEAAAALADAQATIARLEAELAEWRKAGGYAEEQLRRLGSDGYASGLLALLDPAALSPREGEG